MLISCFFFAYSRKKLKMSGLEQEAMISSLMLDRAKVRNRAVSFMPNSNPASDLGLFVNAKIQIIMKPVIRMNAVVRISSELRGSNQIK
jgi:hypothetical protein